MRVRSAVAAAVLLLFSIAAQAAVQSTPRQSNNSSIGIDRIDQRGNNVDRLYWYERTGAGVSVYVFDTGVNYLHNDFGGRVIPIWDFQRQPNHPDFGLPVDEHGTDVASQIGGKTFGVAKNVTMFSVRADDSAGTGDNGTFAQGLREILAHMRSQAVSGIRRPTVVNMSLIIENCDTSCGGIGGIIDQLVTEGALIVTGSNNKRQASSTSFPCNKGLQSGANGIICVAGTDATDDGFTFNDALTANSGTPYEILAPAGRQGVTADTSWYQRGLSHNLVYGQGGFLNGNSMASPLVAGAAALYMETFATLPPAQQPTPQQVEQAILGNATQIFSGRMVYTGCDFIQRYSENPILDQTRFVKQHYLDFLGRQADESGLNWWLGQINNDPNCAADRWGCFGRVNTSRAFFEAIENTETTFFAYRLHRMTYAAFPKPEHPGFETRQNPRMERLFADGRKIGRGVVVGVGNWQATLNANQFAFVDAWVNSAEFDFLYPSSMPNQQFVEALYSNAQVPFDANGSNAVARLDNHESRTTVVLDLIRSPSFASSNHAANPETVRNLWNPMYVLLCYMGYLRRNPDDAPDGNLSGYQFWLDKINHQTFVENNPNGARHEMLRAFLLSPEYGKRFFDDPHCGQPAAPVEEPPDGGGDPCGWGTIC